ncbi:DeoR/GlpR family DNA-binding transcription regulator [Eubacterium barkeri]|uniref:Transcriptional regulator, DeoR family n=1 Tax=Eubacterium barkeri TaxID=1528 RepID=A0A1H3BPY1_EUBBA|nr:DeoR/GlpR family DNA-binding transcription regulator [Eubacterium barkeri]SDX43845.1 transcriptional regulator, DeoR family [Eubacterium barkeri]
MAKKQRLEEIWKMIEKRGTVEVSQLCAVYNVTPMTIRRDLDTLEEQGKIIRTHGGAIINNEDLLLEKPIHLRLHSDIPLKEAIGHAASKLLYDGERVLIASGSTIYHFARMIDNSRRLMVVTNSLNVATELSTRNSISILQLGGTLRSNTLTTTGNFACTMLEQFHFDACFVGATALDAHGVFYHHSLVEKDIFDRLRTLTDQIILLADSSKLGQCDFVKVGQLEAGDTLITDTGIPGDLKAHFEEKGIRILCIQADEDEG